MPAKVNFIIGRAGTGKTHSIYSHIARNEKAAKRSVLIVPDRATFETERSLSEYIGGGILYTSVLSFTTLARRVLTETGNRKTFLSSQGRQMLVRRIVDEASSELTAFSRVSKHRGFSKECDEIILKCKRFSITPDDLLSADNLPARLREKLSDFALIYRKTNEYTEGRYIDGEDLVNSLIERLARSSAVGTDVFIDAPDMLNSQIIGIIKVLFSVAASVTITFRIDITGSAPDRRIFESDFDAYRKLTAIAGEMKCETNVIRMQDKMLHQTGALLHLEKNLFAFPYRIFTESYPDETANSIEIHSASDRRQEVRAAAEAIRNAVKAGMRFRDIAVVLGDPDGYSTTIRRIFDAYSIPYFMDSKRPISSHPISELLLAALRCAEKNFRSEDFIRVFKTGLTTLSNDECDRLENHILKFGLNGSRLYDDAPLSEFLNVEIDESIEESRRTVAKPLVELKAELSTGKDARTRIKALFNYLTKLGIAEKLQQYCEELAEAGQLDSAVENRQIYDTIIEMFNQLFAILDDEVISLSKFSSIIEEGLMSYSIGIIPTTLDQVIIGDMDKIHVSKCRFLLILGMNEGLVPKAKADNAILNDSDLLRMKNAGITVWDSTKSMNGSENLRVYSVISKATDMLRFSYSNEIGSTAAAPSGMISRLRRIFPNAKQTSTASLNHAGETDAAAFAELASGIRNMIDSGEINESLNSLYSHFSGSESYFSRLDMLDKMFFNDNSPAALGSETAMRLYGRQLMGTATRLETFNQCPFRYLIQFGMRLKERPQRTEKENDRGSFIHEAFDKLIKEYLNSNCDFTTISAADIHEKLERILPPMMIEHNNGILLDSARMRAEFQRIAELVETAALAVVKQINAGKFRPFASEVNFGHDNDAYPPLRIQAENGVTYSITGIADRVDKYVSPANEEFIRIIDYKTYGQTFDYTELANGLRIQLPLYASAMQNAMRKETNNPLFTAGMYYLHIGDAQASEGISEDKAENEIQRSFRMNGLTLNDENILEAMDSAFPGSSDVLYGVRYSKKEGMFKGSLADEDEMEETLEFAKKIAGKTLRAIMRGRIEVSPTEYHGKTACKYCPYISICCFDTTAGCRYRRPRAVDADKFFGRENKGKN